MALSKERIGEIALLSLQEKLEKDGLRLNPKEIKRDLHNYARSLGISIHEATEFMSAMLKTAY